MNEVTLKWCHYASGTFAQQIEELIRFSVVLDPGSSGGDIAVGSIDEYVN